MLLEQKAGTMTDFHITHHPSLDPRCRNCRFWDNWNDLDKKRMDTGLCDMFVDDGEFEKRTDWAVSYWDSRIRTGPDFGCIHFEVKDV